MTDRPVTTAWKGPWLIGQTWTPSQPRLASLAPDPLPLASLTPYHHPFPHHTQHISHLQATHPSGGNGGVPDRLPGGELCGSCLFLPRTWNAGASAGNARRVRRPAPPRFPHRPGAKQGPHTGTPPAPGLPFAGWRVWWRSSGGRCYGGSLPHVACSAARTLLPACRPRHGSTVFSSA